MIEELIENHGAEPEASDAVRSSSMHDGSPMRYNNIILANFLTMSCMH